MPSGNFDFKSEQKHPYMKAFGPYMEALGRLIKMDKHGAELENTGPARSTLTLPVNFVTFVKILRNWVNFHFKVP